MLRAVVGNGYNLILFSSTQLLPQLLMLAQGCTKCVHVLLVASNALRALVRHLQFNNNSLLNSHLWLQRMIVTWRTSRSGSREVLTGSDLGNQAVTAARPSWTQFQFKTLKVTFVANATHGQW
jgi:hypothetical protein